MSTQTIKLHAEKSASGSFRWAICHASVKRQRGKADTGGNMAAKRGTVTHDLGEKCLKMKATIPLSMAYGKDARVERDGTVTYLPAGMNNPEYVTVDDEIIAWVEAYIEFVNNLAMGGDLMIEESLSIAHITGEDGAKGTTDVGILYPEEVAIADLKTGFVKVYAAYPFEGDLFNFGPSEMKLRRLFGDVRFPNPQLVIYADSLIETVRFFREIKQVRLIVFQPSLNWTDEYVLSIEDFDIWVQWLREQAAETEKPNARAVPGEKQCQYCKAFPCHDAEQLALTTAMDDFENVDAVIVKQPSRPNLGTLKRLTPFLRLFADRVDSLVSAELRAGNEVHGWKLVEGDAGDRKWKDEEAVKAQLGAMLSPEEYLRTKVASPAQIAEMVVNKRATPKRKLTKEQWDSLQQFVTRDPGGLKVVPDSDPRAARTVSMTDDFEFEDSQPAGDAAGFFD